MNGSRHWHPEWLRRRGATLIETAIVFFVLILLILGTLDLGLAVFRYNLAAEVARIGARAAIVRGFDAPPDLPAWNSATAPAGIQALVQPLLNASGVTANQFQVNVAYPAGNRQGEPVTVTVQMNYQPLMAAWFGGTMTMTAQSTMTIAN
jgi:Flp pilus assembly protein TadG